MSEGREVPVEKIVVINAKGGSGKTIIAVNLAAAYAAEGKATTILDLDSQGSSIRWLGTRPPSSPLIQGIAGYENPPGLTRSWLLRPPKDCDFLIVDTPAALDRSSLASVTHGASAVLMPVMSSDIDIHAAVKCISDLMLGMKSSSLMVRVGIVANRVKTNTRGYQRLQSFLKSLDIPVISTLRDSQNYARSVEKGLGLSEFPHWQVRKDLESWRVLLQWVASACEQAPRSRAISLSGRFDHVIDPTVLSRFQ